MIDYLQLPAVQHALVAATLVAVLSGLIGPFVITRRAAFAVHGVAELSFTGAAAGLLIADDAVLGALIGSLVVAAAIAALGPRAAHRDEAIGVTLAFGLGIGFYLLTKLPGSVAGQATSILFGQVFGIAARQLWLLVGVTAAVIVLLVLIHRPLSFASLDPEVAVARGVPVRLLGWLFLTVLAIAVSAAAQVVGTLLVLSLTITPAAAAHRLSARPAVVGALSVLFAVVSADGGLLVSLQAPSLRAGVAVTAISFAVYVLSRLAGRSLRSRRRSPSPEAGPLDRR